MAIEGPLRELGIHDVFQLLDLSRKTGRLRVTSSLRENEGTVYFLGGRVIGAHIRSNPYPLGQMLVRAGKISEEELEAARQLQQRPGETKRIGELLVETGVLSERELERQVRWQIETVVFELMSWQEGFFSFVETLPEEAPAELAHGVSAESLLMEGARRIDEWAGMAHCIAHLGLVPALADVDEQRPSMIDLLPREWEVLAAIDGRRDLRAVASALGRGEFEVAKVVYGLATTGVVTLAEPAEPVAAEAAAGEDPVLLLADARDALQDGRPHDALRLAEGAVRLATAGPDALVELARALRALDREPEAEDALRRALDVDPGHAPALMLAASGCVLRGELETAVRYWKRVQRARPHSPEAERAEQAVAHATRLAALVEPVHV
jgi:Flp pilus assembly protein TadD